MQGYNFNIPEFHDSTESVPLSYAQHYGSSNPDLSSYWDINDCDEENDKFDEEIANILLNNREEDESVLSIGQKEINLDFEEEE